MCVCMHPLLLLLAVAGECIAGALEWRELIRIAMEIGFAPPILVTSTLYKCGNSAVTDLLSKHTGIHRELWYV